MRTYDEKVDSKKAQNMIATATMPGAMNSRYPSVRPLYSTCRMSCPSPSPNAST